VFIYSAVCIVIMKASATLGAVLLVALAATADAINDLDILNFALNLEYLEAEFYLYSTTGRGIPGAYRGGGPASSGGRRAALTSRTLGIAREIASDELKHVKLLRLALGRSAVPIPKLNIGSAFADAADAALGQKLSPRFSPYATNKLDLLFLHGAFIFEDVGVTAYKGAANLISSKNILQYAAGILAVEAYHAGTIRTLLWQKANTVVSPYGAKVSTIVGAISALRGKVGGGKDQGVIRNGVVNITPTNGNAVAFGRTTGEVINIVTLNGAGNKGGFFPNGLRGTIK
jgi:hypothetical protein